ncbi:MAG: proprotein convertase P-domain-containing protein [Polyangiaceae bacterium]|nr:proprotein convertase P-domain-containing protein [Polyangiaceae bacterium]
MQSSTDGPLLIPDNLSAGVQSVINLGDAYTVTRAVVVVNSITHSVVGDLITTLISPAGTSVTLSANVGSSGDDYVSTVFDAGAATPIASGTAPFRGVYAPTGVLPNVTAQTSKGTWTLKVADDNSGAAGLLKSWTIALCGN